MKKLFTVALSGFLLLLIIGASLQRNALACEFLPVLGYKSLDDQTYIAHDITLEDYEFLRQSVLSASERISKVYGKPASQPRIFITSDLETAERWGANDTASMHRLPWRSCIVVGPEGQSTDVIAHEWLHAEIQHRVGFLRFLNEIPIWFDEGAALTLDYREPFLPEHIDIPDNIVNSVKHRSSGPDFFNDNIKENYQAARVAVIPLINTESFFQDLGRIADGEDFDTVFLTTKN